MKAVQVGMAVRPLSVVQAQQDGQSYCTEGNGVVKRKSSGQTRCF